MSDCRFGVSPVNYPDPDPVIKYTQNIIKLLVVAFIPTYREKMSTKSFLSDLGGQYL